MQEIPNVGIDDLLDRVRHAERRLDNLEDELTNQRTIRNYQELNGQLQSEVTSLRGTVRQLKDALQDAYTLAENGARLEEIMARVDTALDGDTP